MKKVLFYLGFSVFYVSVAFADVEWTPLIEAADFDGVRTDVTTGILGYLGLLILVAGAGILARVIFK